MGDAQVKSQKSSGMEFGRDLSVPDHKAMPKESAHADLLKGKETILIVDDEDVNIEVMTEILEMLGYKVLTAGNGMEAVRIYQEKGKAIDMVILDMIMPDINGGDVFDRLREMNPQVRVLLSTGYSLKGQAADVMKRGCRAFIQKPFHVEELSRKVRQVLDDTRNQESFFSSEDKR